MPDNGLTNSGTLVYINEGRDAFFAGHDGKKSPYETDTHKGWKHYDWMTGFHNANNTCSDEEMESRNIARGLLLQSKCVEALDTQRWAAKKYEAAIQELADFKESIAA